MANNMNMVIKNISGRDMYGEDFTVELQLEQSNGEDLYVVYGSAHGYAAIYVDSKSLLHLFGSKSDAKEGDIDRARKEAIEHYDIEYRDESTHGNIRESEFYKAFDLGAYILQNVDWTNYDDSVAEFAKEFVGRNIDDIESTGTLNDLLNPDYEDEDDE